MPELRATDRASSIFARLQSVDLSLLTKKLQEKEQPEQPAFPEDSAPVACSVELQVNALHGKPRAKCSELAK
ncbi:hypothetical protein [Acidithiobacillus sp.]